MPFQFRSATAAATLPLLLLLAACGPGPVPDEPVGEVQTPPTRPADGLLESPVLQEVVDLQVARDGAGLATFLDHEDPVVRARAAFGLGSVQDPDAGSALAGLLADPSAEVRRDAAFALGQLTDGGWGPSLLGALRDEEDPGVRLALLEALGKAGDGRVLEAVLAMEVNVEEEAARNLAVSRMGLRGVTLPTGITHLVTALNGPSEDARVNAAYFFGRNRSAAPWTGSANSVRMALDSLAPSDPVAMHLILGISLLGDLGDNGRIMDWVRGSPDWRIRSNAAQALGGRTGDPRVRDALVEALEDPVVHVGVSAANALTGAQQLTADEAGTLMEWVQGHPEDWRRAGPILAVLGRMGAGDFLRSWLDGWEEDDVIPRTRGLGAMAFVPSPEATELLMEEARSGQPRIRATALGGLARRWRVERRDPNALAGYFQAFAEGLRTGDPSAVFVSAPALADSLFLPLGSVAVLMNEFNGLSLPEDLEGMQAILRALGDTGSPDAEEFLRRHLDSATPGIAQAAAQGLSNLTGDEVEPPAEVEEEGRQVDWAALAALGARPRMVLETEKGQVTLILDTENAPLTVQTIAGFAEDGLYDDTPFHRVVPNFVVQGGDFARQDGFGGPGFSIRSEFTRIPFHRGVLGMASAGKDTEGSQFFITHSMARHLDGAYTAFGWVESGMNVVDALLQEDRILTARIEPDAGMDLP